MRKFLFYPLWAVVFLELARAQVITDISQLEGALANFVVWMYRVFWILAVAFVIWSAFIFLTAGGDAEKVTKARKILLYAVIAAAIVLLANGIDEIVTTILKP